MEPVAPCPPVDPGGPSAPGGPSTADPGGPDGPVAPEGPCEPCEPGSPLAPVAPVAPAAPAGPGSPCLTSAEGSGATGVTPSFWSWVLDAETSLAKEMTVVCSSVICWSRRSTRSTRVCWRMSKTTRRKATATPRTSLSHRLTGHRLSGSPGHRWRRSCCSRRP